MKTFVPAIQYVKKLVALLIAAVSICHTSQAQVYRTVQSGNWTSPSTWQSGVVPPTTIPVGSQLLINHELTYNLSTSIINNGNFRIYPVSLTPAKFLVPTNVNFDNMNTGVFYVSNASYLQHRFTGGGNSGNSQSGSFKNKGGRVDVINSYVEVAQDWVNEDGGRRTFNNGCLLTGQNFSTSGNGSFDTLINSKISIAWHGSGNYNISEGQSFYQDVKIAIANNGNFSISSGMVKGSITHISLKHPVTGVMNSGNIFISSSANTTHGLSLGIYGIASGSNYLPNGKFNNSPVQNNSLSSNFIDCSIPAGVSTLPVKLASFTATLNNNTKVDLKWTTASEINVSHFAVERSFDGVNFSEAGLVFAFGNATDNTNYSFGDNISNTSATVIYYRLCSVDIDGKTEFSETRMIRISKGKENTISILAFPNPAINEIRITVPAAWQNKAVIYQVYSINGQVVNSKQTGSSSQTETISVSKLAPGMYIIKAICGTETAQERIVKQ